MSFNIAIDGPAGACLLYTSQQPEQEALRLKPEQPEKYSRLRLSLEQQ